MASGTVDTPRQDRGDRGFTLIELLVVIAIMGLLASIVLASLSSARARGRYGVMVAQMREIANAAELARGQYTNCTNPNTGAGPYTSTYPCDAHEGVAPSFVGSTIGVWPAPPCSNWLYDWENWTGINQDIIRISVRTKDQGATVFFYCLDQGTSADCSAGDGTDFRTYSAKAIYCTE